jgi:hypothetical protein
MVEGSTGGAETLLMNVNSTGEPCKPAGRPAAAGATTLSLIRHQTVTLRQRPGFTSPLAGRAILRRPSHSERDQ